MKKLPLILMLALAPMLGWSQLTVNQGITATQAVQGILLGNGVTASNISFTGDPSQLGSFNGTASNIGLNNGVIIGSGAVNIAPGPNANPAAVGNFPGSGVGGNDPDLQAIAGQTIYDAAFLEFDFVPVGDTIRFKYVFASEEYPEFVCCTFNDAFGFFLSGPGITGPFSSPPGFPGGSVNLATLPNTTTVTINTVNVGTAGLNCTPTGCPGGGLGNNAFYVDNTNGATVEYDAFTVTLEAVAKVQCGQTYHIKMAVGDAFDGSYDSGVFLEANSFSSPQVALSSNVDIANGDSILYEGCGNARLQFIRSNAAGQGSTVKFQIGGSATNGTDYPNLADSLVFPPGTDTLYLNIQALNDGVPDGLETFTLRFIQIICGVADTQEVNFYIQDFDSLSIFPNDTAVLCAGDSVPIWFKVDGPPYTKTWWNNSQQDTVWVKPNQTTYYTATFVDSCGIYNVMDSVLVVVPTYQPITVLGSNDTTSSCLLTQFMLWAQGTGGGGVYTYQWDQGLGNNDTVYVTPVGAQNQYTVKVYDQCGDSASKTITITMPAFDPLVITPRPDTLICSGDPVKLWANTTGGDGNYFYSWYDFGNMDTLVDRPTYTTRYVVSVTDGCGLKTTGEVVVDVTHIIANYEYEWQVGLEAKFRGIAISDFPIVHWEWNFNQGASVFGRDVTHDFVIPGEHCVELLVINSYGCEDTIKGIVETPVGIWAPNAFTPNGDGDNDVFKIKGYGVKEFNMLIFDRWGELLYESTDINDGWDGKYKGAPVKQDVYVAKIAAKGEMDSDRVSKVISFSLLR